jgi:hypothetical protein
MIGEQPVKFTGRLQEVFVEDFRRELSEIQNPVAKHLFVLAKASHLTHLRIAEYEELVAAADVTGHYAVGVLLDSCLADKLTFVERTRRLIRNFVATKIARGSPHNRPLSAHNPGLAEHPVCVTPQMPRRSPA